MHQLMLYLERTKQIGPLPFKQALELFKGNIWLMHVLMVYLERTK